MAAAGLKDVDDYQSQDPSNSIKSLVDPVKRCIQVAMEMKEIAKKTTWGKNFEGCKFGHVEIKIGITTLLTKLH